MRASIIVASLNEGDRLWRTVASCLEDRGALNSEIVVADDGAFRACGKRWLKFPRAFWLAI
jgi:hypothetical protein